MSYEIKKNKKNKYKFPTIHIESSVSYNGTSFNTKIIEGAENLQLISEHSYNSANGNHFCRSSSTGTKIYVLKWGKVILHTTGYVNRSPSEGLHIDDFTTIIDGREV